MHVAFIGLGIMGSRMASNLLRRGFTLSVWNRTREKAAALVSEGARWADTPADAARHADVVCTCVADPAAMEAVCRGPDGVLDSLRVGSTLVDFSTLSPELGRELEAACRSRDAGYLEAPVTGSKLGAEAASLLIMCGGDEPTLERVRPVLDAVGGRVIHVGAVGDAAQVKLIGNLLIGHMMQGLSEGAALVKKAGIPLSKLLEVVQASGYASPYWDFKGRALAERNFDPHFTLELMDKDLRLALETGEAHGVDMPGTRAVREVYQQALAKGLGGLDFAATAAVIDPELLEDT